MEAIRIDVREALGKFKLGMMDSELTRHLDRERYERPKGRCNHRNGKNLCKLTLKET